MADPSLLKEELLGEERPDLELSRGKLLSSKLQVNYSKCLESELVWFFGHALTVR